MATGNKRLLRHTILTYISQVKRRKKHSQRRWRVFASHWHWSFCWQVAIACSTYWVKVPTDQPIVYNTKNGWKYALVGQACVQCAVVRVCIVHSSKQNHVWDSEFKRHFVCMANHIRPGTRPFIHVLSSLSPTRNYCVFYLHVSHLTGPAKAQLFML